MKVKDLPSSECTEKKLKEMRKARKTSPYRNAITVLQLSRHIKGLLKLNEEALKKNPKKTKLWSVQSNKSYVTIQQNLETLN